MESGLKSVSKLFTEQIFRIPDYQRGYSWKAKQLKEFWSDLEQLETLQRHYIGVLTLERVPETIWEKWEDDKWLMNAKNFVPYYIVDGQQRLSTIIILLQCVFERLRADEKLNYDSRDEIQSKYIHMHKAGRDGSFLFGYEKDNPSYEYLKTKILNKSSSGYSAGEVTLYTKNLLNAKEFFVNKLKNASLTELSSLYAKVTQQLLFNVFNIEKDVDVHVAFETMNNRGLQLSNLELLKNRLIYLSTKLGEPAGNVAAVRAAINNSWKTVYLYLGKNPKSSLNDDYFLMLHFIMYFGKDIIAEHPKLIETHFAQIGHSDFYKNYLLDEHFTIRRIYAEKKEQRLNSTELHQYAIDLKRVVEAYYYINFPSESNYLPDEKAVLERLRRLISAISSRELYVALLLFSPAVSSSAERISFFGVLEKYFFFTNLMPYRYRQKHSKFKAAHEILSLSGKKTSSEELSKKLQQEIVDFHKTAGFTDALLEGMSDAGYYSWQDLKYFMYEYELHLKKNARRATDKLVWPVFIIQEEDEDLSSIEHILPQTATDPYWREQLKGLNAKQIKKLTNSLGNLVATSAARNSSLKNLPFPEKRGNSAKKTGYKFGSYSEIEVSLKADWGPSEILERGLALLSFMEAHWALDFGTVQNKKKCLGLEFL